MRDNNVWQIVAITVGMYMYVTFLESGIIILYSRCYSTYSPLGNYCTQLHVYTVSSHCQIRNFLGSFGL